MMCESSGDPLNHNWNPSTGDDSWGLFQINLYGANKLTRPSSDWLTIGENNIAYAFGMWKVQGWSRPWGCARKLGVN